MNYNAFNNALRNLDSFFEEQKKLDAVLKVISPSSTGVVEFGNNFIDDYIILLSYAMGDEDGWISWFVFDNDFGDKGLEAKTKGGKMHKIRTARQLYTLIKDSQKS